MADHTDQNGRPCENRTPFENRTRSEFEPPLYITFLCKRLNGLFLNQFIWNGFPKIKKKCYEPVARLIALQVNLLDLKSLWWKHCEIILRTNPRIQRGRMFNYQKIQLVVSIKVFLSHFDRFRTMYMLRRNKVKKSKSYVTFWNSQDYLTANGLRHASGPIHTIRPLHILRELAIKNEAKETYSTVRKRHKIKPEWSLSWFVKSNFGSVISLLSNLVFPFCILLSWGIKVKKKTVFFSNTVTIWIPDKSDIQMVGRSPVVKWSGIQITSIYQTKKSGFGIVITQPM